MRLTTIRRDGDTFAGRVEGGEVVLLPFRDVGELLASGADWRERAAAPTAPSVPLAGADFAPLTPRPEKIICVGVNYASHIAEVGLPTPEHLTIFAKYSRSLIGAYDDIVLPPQSHAVDWEVELGVVIGRPVRHANPEEALAAVAGYTIVNDVTMRDWQLRTSQFLQGKTFEASTPVGPFLVTPDEVDHARALDMTCAVDDTVMQKASTGELLFPVGEIIAYLSSIITLVPGDLIATGTPAGIGAARKPPVFLAAGQTLRTGIAGLGEQANRCVAA
ncbi:fumarylacetoacetate hydrolase family protein [Micromonospora yasonensis]|uniref:fumarylacetoacetate hydrolase family protein n=1 Tax=Micromonospora yasonensis TaxID=1128667 RepID=UPI00222ECF67|nr:fumarylacetoacetate hydrolase family protein [Micromonospora yasonensis]MCW3840926.1 fumarylacetoacetate hydrolase family protein [Micromonospora yasonensis]